VTEAVYSVRGAARRVHRSRWTIQRWMHQGLPHSRPSEHHVRIQEADLLTWYRRKLVANPTTPAGRRARQTNFEQSAA
jgi:hypothetical protein